jgi:hypothetical protein
MATMKRPDDRWGEYETNRRAYLEAITPVIRKMCELAQLGSTIQWTYNLDTKTLTSSMHWHNPEAERCYQQCEALLASIQETYINPLPNVF